MVTGVDVVTALVVTVNLSLLAPAATVTLESTLAATLSLESNTCAPPASAGPLSVTVTAGDRARVPAGLGAGWRAAGGGRSCGPRARAPDCKSQIWDAVV